MSSQDELTALLLEEINLERQRAKVRKEFDRLSSEINNVKYQINTVLNEEEAKEREKD